MWSVHLSPHRFKTWSSSIDRVGNKRMDFSLSSDFDRGIAFFIQGGRTTDPDRRPQMDRRDPRSMYGLSETVAWIGWTAIRNGPPMGTIFRLGKKSTFLVRGAPSPTMSAGLRGTTTAGDGRFTDKESIMMRNYKFPKEFSKSVDVSRVHLDRLERWIQERLQELLGHEDEVLNAYVRTLLEQKVRSI